MENKLKLVVEPLRTGLPTGDGTEIDVLVRVQAPELARGETPKRAPLNVALVVDRSGSMRGHPLDQAKRCASYIVDQLSEDDHVAVVAFDDQADVFASLRATQDKADIKSRIRDIFEGGCTALFDGWRTGAEEAARRIKPNEISRVLLLSDGCANRGLTHAGAIADQCAEMAAKGVTTSTYGVGRHFDEELMDAMAKAGGGQAYYGKTADDLLSSFMEEFDLLSALVARNVRLRLSTASGVVADVRNEYVQNDGVWFLPDVAQGGEVWALLRVVVPNGLPLFDQSKLLSVSVEATDLNGAQIAAQSEPLNLPLVSVDEFRQLPENELVRRRMKELEAAELNDRARHAARRGDWRKVEAILGEAQQLAGDDEYLTSNVERLRSFAARREQEQFSKEAYFKKRKLSRRQTAIAECVDMGEERSRPRYLRRKHEEGEG